MARRPGRSLALAAVMFLASARFAVAFEWIARHDLTSAQYQQQFDDALRKGFRLKQVHGYVSGGAVRFVALWHKISSPGWEARHGLSAEAYQKSFDDLVKKGYRLVFVSGYEAEGADRYNAIWEKRSSPPWVGRHRLTSEQYQSVFRELTKQGYRPMHVSAYTMGGSARYAAIFEKSSGGPFIARHGLTRTQFLDADAQHVKEGYRLRLVDGAYVGSQDLYAAIWDKTARPPLSVKVGIEAKHYQNVFENHFYQGYRPAWIDAHSTHTQVGVRFDGIWENVSFKATDLALIEKKVGDYLPPTTYAAKAKYGPAPGLSIAIAKDGRLVYAAGFGTAFTEQGERVGPLSRFRVASVSKPITGAAVMKLVEKGKLDLDGKVFGPGSYLGAEFPKPSKETHRLEDVTVRQLLHHTAGFGGVKVGYERPDPMFEEKSKSQKELIRWALENDVLVRDPGKQYQYSNFGYCLVGRVIEKVTGKSYEQAVKDELLKPAGVSRVEIGSKSRDGRKPDEVVYYPNQAGIGEPYDLDPPRMDAHGGWIASPIDLLQILVRVDGSPTKQDVMKRATHQTMTTKTSLKDEAGRDPEYAIGWSVGAGQQYHNGAMPGTVAELARWKDGWSYAVLANTRSPRDTWGGDLVRIVQEIITGVSAWPKYDLFPERPVSAVGGVEKIGERALPRP